MTEQDVEAIRYLASLVPNFSPNSIVAPSGESMEHDLCLELWRVPIRPVDRAEWDLDFDPPRYLRGFQMALVCNTFICSTDPMAWINRLATVADTLLIQDLACAPRTSWGRITDPGSGDVQRYSILSHGIVGRTDPDVAPVFDLSAIGAPIVAVVPYFPLGDGSIGKFAALIDLRPLRKAAF